MLVKLGNALVNPRYVVYVKPWQDQRQIKVQFRRGSTLTIKADDPNAEVDRYVRDQVGADESGKSEISGGRER